MTQRDGTGTVPQIHLSLVSNIHNFPGTGGGRTSKSSFLKTTVEKKNSPFLVNVLHSLFYPSASQQKCSQESKVQYLKNTLHSTPSPLLSAEEKKKMVLANVTQTGGNRALLGTIFICGLIHVRYYSE